jgi:hypothetical protein
MIVNSLEPKEPTSRARHLDSLGAPDHKTWATTQGGEVLSSSPVVFSSPLLCRGVEKSDATSSSSSSCCRIFLAVLLGGGWSEPLDSRGALPLLFLKPVEASGRVCLTFFFFGELYSEPEADSFSGQLR